jgi:L,D-peptidoglycan transpeptidase YkuD (ErfK/YbiS/YcfS/YnhG family)
MIIINKSGYLKYKNLKFKCARGKAGIGEKNIEADKSTPKGTYRVVNIYYRKDRIKKIISEFKPIEIKKNMGWCDDPNSKKYNQFIRLPSDYSYEKLYRNDNLYDLILVLNYNMDPITKNKGSAIFIHITNNYKPTKGCVGLKKRNLIKLIKILTKKKQIKIKH